MARFEARKLILMLLILLPGVMLVAVVTGAVNVAISDVLTALFVNSDQADKHSGSSAIHSAIIIQIRIPRVLLAAAIGATLALCGAAMQGLFRNPLADPSLIGVTAGASLGASVMMVIGAGIGEFWFGLPLLSLGAFIGGVLAVTLVYRLSHSAEGTSVATMLLAGIGITALANGLAAALEFYVSNDMLRSIRMWHMGTLDSASYQEVFVAITVAMLLLLLLPRYATALNALLLGESEAKHLGVDTEGLKKKLIILVAAAVGISVSLAGPIAFIGLVVPHILRLLIGPNHRFLLPASALGGALLLVLADNLARVLLAPTELPVGLVMAVIGVPFFISLLTRRHVYGLS